MLILAKTILYISLNLEGHLLLLQLLPVSDMENFLFTFIYPLPVQIKLRHLHIGIIEVCHCCWSPWKHNIVTSLIIEGTSPDLGLYMA